MKRILSQCRKELAQFQRDRFTLALAFLLPFISLIIFGFAIRLESKNIPLFVQDFDISLHNKNIRLNILTLRCGVKFCRMPN
ncbi:hypothetical protein [Nostoc sp.]|uniref:hypothetical protein n=1 Tax=Nostoc sp. TaxID=1180 RepID=UPI003FA59438